MVSDSVFDADSECDIGSGWWLIKQRSLKHTILKFIKLLLSVSCSRY